MPWFRKYFKQDPEPQDPGGGGKPPATPPDGAKELEGLKAQNADLIKRLEALEKPKPPAPEDPDLAKKAALQKEADQKKVDETKQLEAALRFSMGSKDWIKTHVSLLPKSIEGIFAAAEKENFASAIDKDAAIKSGIISEFFQVQSNLNLLTPGLKTALEDFLKLTQDGKKGRAQAIYDSVFEPAFEMLKRVKKAEHLNGAIIDPSDADAAYKQKMIGISRKHYLGEKQDA